ncbi:MAG: PA14 domain-containing protein, partial [Bacteroidota bacterium]
MNGTAVQTGTSRRMTLADLDLSDDLSEIHVRVTNANGFVDSDTVQLHVVNGSRPSISFANIPESYAAGDSITFAATVTDPDQAAVPVGDYTWRIDFHHDDHTHPALSPTSGMTGGAYFVETFGEVDTNVYFRIYLTVEDSTGLTAESYVDVAPRKKTLWFHSVPEGVPFTIDGADAITNYGLRSVEKLNRTIDMPEYAIVGDSIYAFEAWGDGATDQSRIFSAEDEEIWVHYKAYQKYEEFVPGEGTLTFYKDTAQLQTFYIEVQVAEIKENWDVYTPWPFRDPPLENDFFSTKWEGNIFAPVSDWYTFYLYHDAVASLEIGGDLLLDRSYAGNTHVEWDTVRVWLEGGREYPLVLNYDHHDYISRVELEWEYSLVPRHTVTFGARHPWSDLREITDGYRLYPNPTDGEEVTLYVNPNVLTYGSYRLMVYDINGQLWHRENGLLESEMLKINVAELPAGTYLFRLLVGPESRLMRFVKSR